MINIFGKVLLASATLATVVLSSTLVRAQRCANSNHTPLTKVRLEEIANNLNIQPTQVELKFEAFALNTILPISPIVRNLVKFPSQDRLARAGIANVQPDGVMPLIVVAPLGINTFLNSVFYESKAVRPTRLPPSYQKYQILGFLDALRNSPASGSGVPAIVFMTTSDVTSISLKTRVEATLRGVGVLHAIACEIPNTPATLDNLQLGEATIVNPETYFFSIVVPIPVGPGKPGRL